MLSCIRLPLRFDPAALRADVDGLSAADWIPHFNTSYYEGDWSGVALRSLGGISGQIYPDPNPTGSWEDTEILARCPALSTAVEAFHCEKLSVRLLRLGRARASASTPTTTSGSTTARSGSTCR